MFLCIKQKFNSDSHMYNSISNNNQNDYLPAYEEIPPAYEEATSIYKEALTRGKPIEISNMEDFRKFTLLDDTKELPSVAFHHMEINEEFNEKFWNVFTDNITIKNLIFDHCSCSEGFSFDDLIASGCPSDSLTITNCGLSVKEASAVLLQTNPYTVQHVDFSGNGFKKSDLDFQKMLERFVEDRLCLNRKDLCVK